MICLSRGMAYTLDLNICGDGDVAVDTSNREVLFMLSLCNNVCEASETRIYD